ncbi:uncharacterized protein LOC130744024 [Lotus japonicus]|uniref:uncharacterized protein LOC130744024 n=1 Tax=Lotus japonicus TaxID=34305 RepID=UPI0025895CA8|nr:uncharacterized protein LOC130744024 [Lotus japonicus]
MERTEKADSADGRVFPHLVVGLATGQASPTLRSRSLELPQDETQDSGEVIPIAKRSCAVTCKFSLKELQVLCEIRVDFKNLAENGVDFLPAVKAQGWDGYFNRLSCPIYDKLVKEFWKHAECDDYQVVSHVLGKKIIISKRSIALLLGGETIKGYRFQTNDSKSKKVKDNINSVLYANWKSGKSDYKTKDLHPDLRIWHKIMLNCLNPRPSGSSPDYINFNQKVMMFFIKTNQKICLPYFLFTYLKDCIKKSRTTACESKSTIKYIPFERLLSDIFVESNLVNELFKAGCTEDLTTLTGEALTSTTLKRMGLIDNKVGAASVTKPAEIMKRKIPIDDFPLWSKADDPEAILHYINDLRSQGLDIDVDEFFRNLPDAPDYDAAPKRKPKRKNVDASDAKDDSEDGNDDEPPPQKKKKKVKIVTKVIQQETQQAPRPTRVTRSSVRNSSKFVVLSDDDESDDAVIGSSLIPTPTLPPLSLSQIHLCHETKHHYLHQNNHHLFITTQALKNPNFYSR